MEQIKEKVQACYDAIKKAEEELERLRKLCKHPETEYVNYMWAPGHIQPHTKVCSICGEVIIEEEDLGWQSISMGLGGDQYEK